MWGLGGALEPADTRDDCTSHLHTHTHSYTHTHPHTRTHSRTCTHTRTHSHSYTRSLSLTHTQGGRGFWGRPCTLSPGTFSRWPAALSLAPLPSAFLLSCPFLQSCCDPLGDQATTWSLLQARPWAGHPGDGGGAREEAGSSGSFRPARARPGDAQSHWGTPDGGGWHREKGGKEGDSSGSLLGRGQADKAHG